MPSAGMLTHLGQNVTFLIPIWTMLATDNTRASYCAHTRNLTYNSINYSAAPVEPSRATQTLGLQANHIELFGVLDSTVTESDIQGGRWKNARITSECIVIDVATGQPSATITDSIQKIKGRAGRFTLNNGTFRVEQRSLSDLMSQEIGDMTSPVDRNRQLIDLVGSGSIGTYTFARTVSASPAPTQRVFAVSGATFAADYLKYGKITFTSGANNGRSMEIKSHSGNTLTLQLPMMSAVTAGDGVSIIAGYDGTRDQARDKFSAAANLNSEPDLPGLRAIIQYPE